MTQIGQRDEVFIIGGGSSLQNFPFHQLKNKDTIAVNVACLDVPNPTYCITADSGIFRKLCDGKFKEVDSTWVLVTNPEHCSMKWRNGQFKHVNSGYVYNLFAPNMVIQNSGTDGIGFSFKDFKTGYSSGFCGFQLAVLLGYKKIYLMGFDLEGSIKSHYHDRYKNRKISNETLDKFYRNFVYALKEIKEKTDIEVISCSAVSKLNKIIPYKTFDSISDYKKEKPHKILSIKEDDKAKKLSLLICSVSDRTTSLNKLLNVIDKQCTDEVEVLVEIDNKKITIGEKRNILLNKAKGDYVAFIDDDDLISDDYISKVLKAIKTKPDCCGIEGTITSKKRNRTRKFIHSIKYKSWYEENEIYYRCPNHLSPVKRELALQVGFPNISRGEDMSFSLKLRPLLKSEVYIEEPIYFYLTG